jgi:hypothetical protein
MDTYPVSGNTTHRIFRAVMPGFSVFAVTAQSVAEGQEMVLTNESGNESGVEPITSSTSPYPVPFQYFIISGIMFAVAGLMIWYYSRKKKVSGIAKKVSQERGPADS